MKTHEKQLFKQYSFSVHDFQIDTKGDPPSLLIITHSNIIAINYEKHHLFMCHAAMLDKIYT